MADKTLYDILQVSATADVDIIDAAYTRLRQKHQDDEDVLKVIKMAYDTLSGPARRASYDQRIKLKMAPSPSHTGYRSDFSDAGANWWRSPKVAAIGVVVMVMIGVGMYLSYAKHDKEVRVVREVATSAARGVDNDARRVDNDVRRVDTERVYIDRSMDNLDRRTDIRKETLNQSVDLARMEQQRRTAEMESWTAQENERLRLQREREKILNQQRLNAEQRLQEDRTRMLARQQLERDRRELCELERNRYGRAQSCY